MMSYRKSALMKTAAALIGCLGVAASSWAASPQTATLNVSASVTQDCTVTTSPVAFGAYDPLAGNAAAGIDLDATGQVNVTCTKGSGSSTAVVISLGPGTNAAGNTGTAGTSRAMKEAASTNYLDYELYLPSATTAGAACAYTTVWNSTNTLTPSGTNWGVVAGAQSFNVCGRVPKGQDPLQGSYADTVTATVTF